MVVKTAKKPAKVVKKAAAKRVAEKAATPRKTTAKASDSSSAAQRIDRKIESLNDWRGERLAEIRSSSTRSTRTWSKNGSGWVLRSGRTTACTRSPMPTRTR